jgi:opacity protein-like surface antigen/outer membrane protein OmpA-like peptidoglycan-associated protein
MIINSIKQFVATGILLVNSLIIFAQAPFTGSSQFRKFSVGINAGALRPSIVTGGSNDFTKPLYTFGYGANIKYQFTHLFGVQADFLKGNLKGNNDNDYWNDLPANDRKIASFKTDLNFALSLSGVFTFGNINWLSAKTRVVPYITAGGGLTHYEPVTVATGTTTEVPFFNGKTLHNFFIPVGVGLKFNLSDLINLDLGYRANIVDNDNFDGTTTTHADVHKDKFSYGFLGIEFAFGKKPKKQLMFDNPPAQLRDSMQAQVNRLQTQVDTLNAKLSTVDSDGDGVPDQYDKEPNTPAGCPVDFRGVTRDTDGDGVPDCKDKQLITPTDCQPVDADGVGKCPDPECCKNDSLQNNACLLLDLPSLSFKGKARSLNSDAKAMLATVASKLKSNADCSITVTGYPAATKASQSLCNKRVEAIKTYLTEKEGISADRIITSCEPGGGDTNVIDIKGQVMQ